MIEFEDLEHLSSNDVDFQLSRFMHTVKKYGWVIRNHPNVDEKSLDLGLISNSLYDKSFKDSIHTKDAYQTKYPITDKEYGIDIKTDPTTFNNIETLMSHKKKVRFFLLNQRVVYSDVVPVYKVDECIIEWNMRDGKDWNETRDSLTENMFNWIMYNGLKGKKVVDVEYNISIMVHNDRYIFGDIKLVSKELRGQTIENIVFV